MSSGRADAASDKGHTATLVFSDLAGSTSLGERLDAETLRSTLTRYFGEMEAVFTAHGGTIEKIIGDAIVAVFEGPDPGDGASRAVRAVQDARGSLEALNVALEDRLGITLTNRTGVATGQLTVERLEAGHSVLSGPVVAIAESLERAAPPLGALVDSTTQVLLDSVASFEPVPPVAEKGSDRTVEAFLLTEVTAGAAGPRSAATCATCGDLLEGGAVVCSHCGAAAATVRETRRTVSIVFADPRPTVVDGTAQSPEGMATATPLTFARLREVLERHGATVETYIGDAVMAVFGLPIRHEDDALRAVRAADEMRRAVDDLNDDLRDRLGIEIDCRIGVNTGEVIAGDASTGQRLVTGDTVNVAARLEQAAGPGEVLLGDLTFRLVRDRVITEPVEPLTLKGKAEPVPAHRLVSVADARTSVTRLPLVGRDDEMSLLVERLHGVSSERRCAAVLVLGEAGVGKTRLLEEFERTAVGAGARVIRGRCLPYGDGITFWPIVEMLRFAADIADTDSPDQAVRRIRALVGPENEEVTERLAAVVGLSSASFSVSESFWAVRRLCEIVGAEKPLVLWFEDLHWAEQTLLELVEHLAASIEHTPVVLVCAARPSLQETSPDWTPDPGARLIALDSLSPEHADLIIDNVIGMADLPGGVRSRIVDTGQGNPLFVEQLLSMLIDDGRLTKTDGRWTATDDLSSLAMPPSIEALLAARIDRLADEERRVVEPASVVGRVFAADAVRHLLAADPIVDQFVDHLDALSARRVVEPAGSADMMYRFLHLMLRDAAYAGLLKETRARLHEQFVRWADRVNEAAGRSREFDEILGFHLEQAHRYRVELGAVDDHTAALGREGSGRLAAAGGRAFARGDMPAAAALLSRAAALLDDDHPDLAFLLLRAGEARFETGDFAGSAEALERSARVAGHQGDDAAQATAEVERLRVAYLTGAAGSREEVDGRVADLDGRLSASDHDAGLARLWRLRAMIDVVGARFGAAEGATLRMVEHAERAGDDVMEIRSLQNIALLAPLGHTPVVAAIAQCEDVLRRVASDRRTAANTRRALAQLHAMTGDIDTARLLYREARATLEQLGWFHDAALVSLDSARAELLAGDPAVAEADLQRDYDTLTAMGDTFFKPTTAGYLAEALCRQGRYDDAEVRARECAETADPDDVADQVHWRSAIAQVEASRGEQRCLGTAREAVDIAETCDSPIVQAHAYTALAQTAALLGDDGAVGPAAAAAVGRYDAKGASAGVDLVRRLVGGEASNGT